MKIIFFHAEKFEFKIVVSIFFPKTLKPGIGLQPENRMISHKCLKLGPALNLEPTRAIKSRTINPGNWQNENPNLMSLPFKRKEKTLNPKEFS